MSNTADGRDADGVRFETSILHVDMDAFFASVEALEDPDLRGKPLIVGGDGGRGVVASCSYEARFYGVRSAMPSGRAKRLCPQAVFVPGQYHLYEKYSRDMHEVFETFTPMVEGIGLDEAFLDVSGARRLFGAPGDMAWRIREAVQAELGLSVSVGVANTKHVAKLASVAAKPKASAVGPVDAKGVVVVAPDAAIDFLHGLVVRALWGVGPKAAEKLARYGVTTVGELAGMSLGQLEPILGRASARHLHDLAWNRDHRDVVVSRGSKSVGHEQTYPSDLYTNDDVHRQLIRLADAVANRLRKSGVVGRTVTLKVRFGSFETINRSRTLDRPTASSTTLAKAASAMHALIDISPGVRLLGLSVSGLEVATRAEQLSLDAGVGTDDLRLDEAVDLIRARYGDAAVVPAPLITAAGPDLLRRGDQQWGPSSGRESPTSRRESASSRRESATEQSQLPSE